MKNACFWSIVALLATVLCLATAEEPQYKVYESGSRQVEGKLCGDQISLQYNLLCHSGKRKRRSALMDEQEALSFLLYRSPRSASGSSTSSGTDIVEECCTEGCASEEIWEYC